MESKEEVKMSDQQVLTLPSSSTSKFYRQPTLPHLLQEYGFQAIAHQIETVIEYYANFMEVEGMLYAQYCWKKGVLEFMGKGKEWG